MNDYLNLLLDFQSLPREAKARTFMEVSGQAHYENVASNILAFYLDPKEEHGMKDLLLSAFLEMVRDWQKSNSMPEIPETKIPETVSITREHPAEDNKRIDLVIDCEAFTIGIENKIYHWEANDFVNYARVLDALGDRKAITLKTVLGLHAEAWKPLPPGGFLRFTYAQLWTQVRSSLGLYLPQANPKWVTYLIDFMETTSRLTGESPSNKEFTDFFLKHTDTIEQLVADRQTLLNRLDGYNYALESNLKDDLAKHECIKKVWVWQRIVFVVDFQIQGHRIALDLAHSLTDWRLTVFDRDQKSQEFLCSFVNTTTMRECSPDIKLDDGRYLLHSWDIHATQIDLQDTVLKWVNAIVVTAAALPSPLPSEPVH
ncbi:MAG: PD-(D/E)XK nuclease family protein [Akkermansiaceae bacterium]|jgi:hypothetical protein|nr:PD-(D/E)XK nuclease family protein [Akkermansiaceae bacterium]